MRSFFNSTFGGVAATVCALGVLIFVSAKNNIITTLPLAPEVNYVLTDGSIINTASFKGKVTYVNFWATSCSTCVAEMPNLTATFQKFSPQGFDVLAVAMPYDPPAYVMNYTQTRQLPFKVAIDNTGQVTRAWGDIKATPTGFLLNQQGRIVKTYVGAPDFAQLQILVADLLLHPVGSDSNKTQK